MTFAVRTPEEILAYIDALGHKDLFGTITGDLAGTLTFEEVRPLLKVDADPNNWNPISREPAAVLACIRDYLSFAWEKANNQRGLSAARSLDHMKAWLWLLGEDAAADALSGYTMYGKPQLRAISEAVGYDWAVVDDGNWSNDEDSNGVSADWVAQITLPWTEGFADLVRNCQAQ